MFDKYQEFMDYNERMKTIANVKEQIVVGILNDDDLNAKITDFLKIWN